MHAVFGLILISLSVTISLAQTRAIPVKYNYDPNAGCKQVVLGSGFEKSGMVQYVARSKIIESKWIGKQLSIKIFVVSDCCPPDFLGYLVRNDTLQLYYGDKRSIPVKEGQPKEVEICMCGHNGCGYQFEYKIDGLKKNRNYLVGLSDVLGIGSRAPIPIGYTDGRFKSINYPKEGGLLEVRLDEKIDEAISSYKKLEPLYDSLLQLHRAGGSGESEIVGRIKWVWIDYFTAREAIYDKYVRHNLNTKKYSFRVDKFELDVQNQLKSLMPKLEIVSTFLSGGALSEAIKQYNR